MTKIKLSLLAAISTALALTFSPALAQSNEAAKQAYDRGYKAWRDDNDYDRAIKEFTNAIKLDPGYIKAYDMRATNYKSKKDYAKALDDYTEMIRIAPDKEKDKYFSERGHLYRIWIKDYDKAIDDYTKAIQLKPDNYNAYYQEYRAESYYKKGDYKKAIDDYTKVIELRKDEASYHDYHNRGRAYFKNEDYKKAVADYDKAIQIEPDWDILHDSKKEAVEKLGGSYQAAAPSNASTTLIWNASSQAALKKVMEWVNSKYSGGDMYKGETTNGNRGWGIYSWQRGSYYLGYWANGNRNGNGIYMAGDGYNISNCDNCVVYSGNWNNGDKSGEGTCYDKYGNIIYTGKFSNDKPTGTYPTTGDYPSYKFQTIDYSSGNRYIGETKNGQRHGSGVFIWENGNIWLGFWKEDERSGNGVYVSHNASYWERNSCRGDNCTQNYSSQTQAQEQQQQAQAQRQMQIQQMQQGLMQASQIMMQTSQALNKGVAKPGQTAPSYQQPASGSGYSSQPSQVKTENAICGDYSSFKNMDRTYDDYSSRLLDMKTYPKKYNDSDRRSYQSSMRSIREKWNAHGCGNKIYKSNMEDWNGGK